MRYSLFRATCLECYYTRNLNASRTLRCSRARTTSCSHLIHISFAFRHWKFSEKKRRISFIYYSVRRAPLLANRKKLDFNRFDFSEKYGEARNRGRAKDGSIKTKSISIYFIFFPVRSLTLVKNISQILGTLV